MVTIIGITGFAHSGKDTSADYIMSKMNKTYRVIKVSLADQLKVLSQKLVKTFYGVDIPLEYFYDFEKKEQENDELPLFNGQKFKIRTVLQIIGDITRTLLGTDVWCKYIREKFVDCQKYDVIIISDMRMINEFEFFKRLEGDKVIQKFISTRITRDNRVEIDSSNKSHISETSVTILPVDKEIINNTTLHDLYNKLDVFLERLSPPLPPSGSIQ